MSLLKKALDLRHAGDNAAAAETLEKFLLQQPSHSLARYLLACCYDSQGLERLAIPQYESALAGNLTPVERRSSYLGLGSSYRAIGEYDSAKRILEAGLTEFQQAPELEVFLAMTEANLGNGQRAVERLLRVITSTTGDEQLLKYREAIEFYAKDISASWGGA